jgi:hypothetical protein
MCASNSDCGSRVACAAGRCVAEGATAAIDNARRLLFAPVDQAFLHRHGDAADAGVVTLGRAGDGGSVALVRFAVPLPPEATVLEAYLLLERAIDVDADPLPITLHAVPVRSPWDGRSVSWATAPRMEEVGAPVTRVVSFAGPFVRLDLREIVQGWRKRGQKDFGVAIVCDGASPTGVSFAWSAAGGASGERRDPTLLPPAAVALEAPSPFEPRPIAPVSSVGEPRAEFFGPRLELYVR